MPEPVALAADHAASVRHAMHEHELLVPAGERAKEPKELVFTGIAVVLRPYQAHRAPEPHRIDHRHIDGHIEVGSAGHAVPELQLEISKGFDQGRIGLAGDVTVKDVLDLRQSERPARVGFVELDLLAPAFYLRRIFPGVSERMKNKPF